MSEQERQRLRALYAAMSDDELLKLVIGKAGLTDVAQQAVDAEVSARGLTFVEPDEEPEAMPELLAAEGDPSLVELMTFQLAIDAETALRALDEREIPIRMEPAIRRMVEGGPLVKTNWMTFYVERTRQEEAVEVLRARMGLFPVLTADELEAHGGDSEDEDLMTVGHFEEAADAEAARKALTEVGIWFRVEDGGDDPDWVGTAIEVRMEDMERALQAVEAAFAEE